MAADRAKALAMQLHVRRPLAELLISGEWFSRVEPAQQAPCFAGLTFAIVGFQTAWSSAIERHIRAMSGVVLAEFDPGRVTHVLAPTPASLMPDMGSAVAVSGFWLRHCVLTRAEVDPNAFSLYEPLARPFGRGPPSLYRKILSTSGFKGAQRDHWCRLAEVCGAAHTPHLCRYNDFLISDSSTATKKVDAARRWRIPVVSSATVEQWFRTANSAATAVRQGGGKRSAATAQAPAVAAAPSSSSLKPATPSAAAASRAVNNNGGGSGDGERGGVRSPSPSPMKRRRRTRLALLLSDDDNDGDADAEMDAAAAPAGASASRPALDRPARSGPAVAVSAPARRLVIDLDGSSSSSDEEDDTLGRAVAPAGTASPPQSKQQDAMDDLAVDVVLSDGDDDVLLFEEPLRPADPAAAAAPRRAPSAPAAASARPRSSAVVGTGSGGGLSARSAAARPAVGGAAAATAASLPSSSASGAKRPRLAQPASIDSDVLPPARKRLQLPADVKSTERAANVPSAARAAPLSASRSAASASAAAVPAVVRQPPAASASAAAAATPRGAATPVDRVSTAAKAGQRRCVFLLGGFPKRSVAKYERIIGELGATVVPAFRPECTHVVLFDLKRTEKFMAAAAAGKWILKPSYLDDSGAAGRRLLTDEAAHEWHGDEFVEADKMWLGSPRRWRLEAGRNGTAAFYGHRVLVLNDTSPPPEVLRAVLQAGRATVFGRDELLSQMDDIEDDSMEETPLSPVDYALCSPDDSNDKLVHRLLARGCSILLGAYIPDVLSLESVDPAAYLLFGSKPAAVLQGLPA